MNFKCTAKEALTLGVFVVVIHLTSLHYALTNHFVMPENGNSGIKKLSVN